MKTKYHSIRIVSSTLSINKMLTSFLKSRYEAITVILVLSFVDLVASDDLVHVIIKNGLRNRRELIVHCNSKDDDLGQRTLDEEANIVGALNWIFGTQLFSIVTYHGIECHYSILMHESLVEIKTNGYISTYML